MKSAADERIDQVLEAALQKEDLDVLQIRNELVKRLERVVAGREGWIHAAVLRGLRRGRLRVTGASERGLARYGLAVGDVERAPFSAPEVDPSGPDGRVARRLVRVLRDPVDRDRVAADVTAHRRALRESGALKGFGPVRSLRPVLKRVDRGRPAVLFVDGLADVAKRLVIHEGPWILGAVVAFLVIRAFLAEVFVIPSASMLPTLQLGDRVVVFKPGGKERPTRWDIVTFDRDGTTYVKRAVALGGERVALQGGDVYVDGSLAAKPAGLRDALRRPYARWTLGSPGADAEWPAAGPDEADDTRPAEVVRAYAGAPLWSSERRDGRPPATGDVPVRDAYVSLRATRPAGAGVALDLVFREEGAGGVPNGPVRTRYALELRDEGVRLEVIVGGETVWIGRQAAAPTGEVDLELAYVDGSLLASAGGARWEREVSPARRPPPAAVLEPRIRRWGEGAVLREVSMDVDLHYTRAGQLAVAPSLGAGADLAHGWAVPEGSVFFLGDNTTNSRDSRYSDVGAIPEADLIGPVRFRIWPPARLGTVP